MRKRALDKTASIGLTAALAVGLLLRTLWLGRADLWTDEIQSLHATQLPLGDVITERLAAGHVPLYFVMLKAWTALCGASQMSLRLPSALLGTAALVPAFLLFRRLLPARAALWAIGFAAIDPLFIELSREARMYPLLLLAFLVAAEAAAATREDGRVRRRFWIAVAVAPLVHPSWAFAAVPLAWWAWRERCAVDDVEVNAGSAPAARRRGLTIVTIGLLSSIALLGIALTQASPQHQTLTRRAWPLEALVFALRPYLGSRPGSWFPTGGLAVVAWAALLTFALRQPRSPARQLGIALALGVPIASLASGVLAHVPWGPARYLQVATLGGILLAALGTSRAQTASATSGTSATEPDPLAILRQLPPAFLAFTLFVLSAISIGTAPDLFGRTATAAVRAVPADAEIWTDDASIAIVLAHYTGRPIRVGMPASNLATQTPHWRALIETDPAGDRTGDTLSITQEIGPR